MEKPTTYSHQDDDDDDILEDDCPIILNIPEPKTLLRGELDKARQAALEVIRTHTEEEARKIFLEGYKPKEDPKKTTKDSKKSTDDK